MDFRLVTMFGVKEESTVYSVTLPTVTGEISVFPGHEPYVTVAAPGVISVRYSKDDSDDKLEYFGITGGVIEINQTGLRVLVDEADTADDVVESESKAAIERARKMQEDADDQVEIEKAHELMDRHAVKLKVAELRRRKRNY